MAFNPRIRTSSIGVGSEFEFLASEHGMWKRAGATLDSAVVGLDADGHKYLAKGTTLGEITATGKWGPYDDLAADGRETAKGFLPEQVDLADGDLTVGVIIHGSVLEARVSGLDASGKVDLAGAFLFQ